MREGLSRFFKTREYRLSLSSGLFIVGGHFLLKDPGSFATFWDNFLDITYWFIGLLLLYYGSCEFLRVFPPTKRETP